MFWLFCFNTGRGHCRARILRPPRPGRNGLGAVLVAVIKAEDIFAGKSVTRNGLGAVLVAVIPSSR